MATPSDEMNTKLTWRRFEDGENQGHRGERRCKGPCLLVNRKAQKRVPPYRPGQHHPSLRPHLPQRLPHRSLPSHVGHHRRHQHDHHHRPGKGRSRRSGSPTGDQRYRGTGPPGASSPRLPARPPRARRSARTPPRSLPVRIPPRRSRRIRRAAAQDAAEHAG